MLGLIIGSIIGGFIMWYILTKKFNKTHRNCPYNKNKSNYKSHAYTISGKSINIKNGKLLVDGKLITDYLNNCYVKITVEGNCQDITTTNADIIVNGNVTNNIETTTGDVTVANDIGGNVKTNNGDVECNGNIIGNVSTNIGNVNYKI